jgi:hypothetical protein
VTDPTPGYPGHAAPAPPLVARIRKALVAAAGIAAILVSSGALDDTTEAVVSGLLAAGTAFGVWAVPNARRP